MDADFRAAGAFFAEADSFAVVVFDGAFFAGGFLAEFLLPADEEPEDDVEALWALRRVAWGFESSESSLSASVSAFF